MATNPNNFNQQQLALAEQYLIAPPISGAVLPALVNVASAQVLGIDAQRLKVTFHNPGNITLYVCQAVAANGTLISAGATAGSFLLEAGQTWVFEGKGVAGAWNAAAQQGANNPLTILFG